LGCLDEFFDGELHCLYDKVAAIRNANHIVVEEKVGCEFVLKGVGDMARDEATNGGGDSKGVESGGVRRIFV
jgi:hypothetical protein